MDRAAHRPEYRGFTYTEGHGHQPPEKRRFEVAPDIHVFVGYGDSNISIIIVHDGYILVDTGSSPIGAAEVSKEIAKLTQHPLKAVILTHSHPDHRGGGEVLLQGQPSDVPVWARANFGSEQSGLKGLEKIAALRGRRQFGFDLPAESCTPNLLLIPMPDMGKPVNLIVPNSFMKEDKQELRIAGVEIELYAAPGETADHLVVWLPGKEILFVGDSMYRSFPNIYPVRGSGFRDLATWAATLKRLSGFRSKAMVMGHTAPEIGPGGSEMLSNYGEAIQYVLDATMEGMNAGMTPDELAVSVQLPARLRELPYLAELYGGVPWAVRSVFAGLLGWFDGNPSRLMPLSPEEEAERMAVMAGGADNLLRRAETALAERDYPWAAQLCDYLLVLKDGQSVARARAIKSEALEGLSNVILPITGKNYLRTCAMELRK